ncbi:hypothetical protein RYX36_012069 [Vicia faba]
MEIESRDKVQVSVTADTNIGTFYYVTVPIRRGKSEYQHVDETGTITNNVKSIPGVDCKDRQVHHPPVLLFLFYPVSARVLFTQNKQIC